MLPQYDLRPRVIQAINETHSRQAKRLARYLLENGPTLSGELSRSCAIQNLSGAAAKIRPALERHGVTIQARPPNMTIKNRFGELSHAHVWSLQGFR